MDTEESLELGRYKIERDSHIPFCLVYIFTSTVNT